MGTSQNGLAGVGGAGTGVSLFELADRRLSWINDRQSVLSQNIANADTPGWKERDLPSFADVMAGRILAGGGPTRTQPMHLSGTVAETPGSKILRGERAPDGNAVSIDEQMIKVAQTETDHEAVTAVYRKYMGMYRMALGR
jgi:flagellar basal-body rod protein FlgB